MGKYNFREDLKDSEESVDRVIKFLSEHDCTQIQKNDDGKYDISYINKSGQPRTAEVKNDLMWNDTGNVAIEYVSRKKPSGISTSKADVWYYVLGDILYMVPIGRLRAYLFEHWDRYRRVNGGDNNTSKLILLPLDEFYTVFIRLN